MGMKPSEIVGYEHGRQEIGLRMCCPERVPKLFLNLPFFKQRWRGVNSFKTSDARWAQAYSPHPYNQLQFV